MSAASVKRLGHNRPLEFTGEGRMLAMGPAKIRGTNKARVVLPSLKFNFRHPKSRISMRDEITRVLPDEARTLVDHGRGRLANSLTDHFLEPPVADYTYKPYALTLHTDAMGGAVHVPDILSKGIQVNSGNAGNWSQIPRRLTTSISWVARPSPTCRASRSRRCSTTWDSLALRSTRRRIPALFRTGKVRKNGFAGSSNHRSYAFRKGSLSPSGSRFRIATTRLRIRRRADL